MCVRARARVEGGLHGSVPPPSLPPSHPLSQSRRSKVSKRGAETLQTLLSAAAAGAPPKEVRTGKRVDTSEEKLFPRAEWRSGGTEPVLRSTCEPRGHRSQKREDKEREKKCVDEEKLRVSTLSLAVRSVTAKHDGVRGSGALLGLPERAPAHGGTLGRAAAGPTEAVRRAEVGESRTQRPQDALFFLQKRVARAWVFCNENSEGARFCLCTLFEEVAARV